MRPETDEYPARLEAVMNAIVREGIEAGARELTSIAYARKVLRSRPVLPQRIAASIFKRDRFHCRYCGARTVPTPIMRLLARLYPQEFPYHPNWKGGQTHPAVISRSPVIDHVVPGSLGGSWTNEKNLVTACWPCT